jgi:hypothetical protein
MNKWDCIKLKSFLLHSKRKSLDLRDCTQREKIFASYSSKRGVIYRIYREPKKLSPQRINIPMKKWANELNINININININK